MDEKKCIVCGDAFRPKNKRSRLCGDLCEKKYFSAEVLRFFLMYSMI